MTIDVIVPESSREIYKNWKYRKNEFNVKLITPIAMNEKLNFAIREGGKTVGAGVVTKIIK